MLSADLVHHNGLGLTVRRSCAEGGERNSAAPASIALAKDPSGRNVEDGK